MNDNIEKEWNNFIYNINDYSNITNYYNPLKEEVVELIKTNKDSIIQRFIDKVNVKIFNYLIEEEYIDVNELYDGKPLFFYFVDINKCGYAKYFYLDTLKSSNNNDFDDKLKIIFDKMNESLIGKYDNIEMFEKILSYKIKCVDDIYVYSNYLLKLVLISNIEDYTEIEKIAIKHRKLNMLKKIIENKNNKEIYYFMFPDKSNFYYSLNKLKK
jgi:hypothetical protein